MATGAEGSPLEINSPNFEEPQSRSIDSENIASTLENEPVLIQNIEDLELTPEDADEVVGNCGEAQQDALFAEEPCTEQLKGVNDITDSLDFAGEDKEDDEAAESTSSGVTAITGERKAEDSKNVGTEIKVIADSSNTGMKGTMIQTTDDEANPQQSESSDFSEYLLLGLPTDALHAVTSFLSLEDCCNFGLCSSGAARVFGEVLRKVRMHGFRCATEVVTAWKLNQHSDAKELSALYISSGVPIYPQSLGHSYHTVVWRMSIESQEMQPAPTPSNGANMEDAPRNEGAEAILPGAVDPVDRFFSERYETRAREGLNYSISYLEEKALYMLNAAKKASDTNGGTRNVGRPGLQSPNRFAAVPGLAQQHLPHHHGHAHLHDAHFHGEGGHAAHFGRFRPHEAPTGQTRVGGLTRSKSHSDVRSRDPKVLVRVHRHLLDQHLLGRPCVDDKDGTMITAPVSLSADFFHPVFKVGARSISGKSVAEQSGRCSLGDGLVHGEHLAATNRRSDVVNTPGGGVGGLFAEPVAGAMGPVMPLAETDDSDRNGGAVAHRNVSNSAEAIFEPPNNGTDHVVAAARRALESSSSLVMNPTVANPYPDPAHATILVNVDINVYSAMTGNKESDSHPSKEREVRRQLRSRFAFYQRKLEGILARHDSHGFDECLLDFWDEFFSHTANIHYFDRNTAVPRISCLHQFLTKPCPKAIGVVQCEIERIKLGPKKKGVNMTGRFFPTYEYRLFIRHRPPDTMDGSEPPRRDTVLMVAKNKGRKQFEGAGSNVSNKKGANNYFLYLPDRDDVELHFNCVNGLDGHSKAVFNGADGCSVPMAGPTLLGRLQSNFIGTEFQIFRSQGMKKPSMKSSPKKSYTTTVLSSINSASGSEDEIGYDSGGVSSDNVNSSRRRGRFARLSLRRSGNMSESSTILEDETPNRLRRSRSSGDMNEGSRRIRISRRAIANNSEETVLQHVHPVPLEIEDGAITYTANLLGSRPRIMDVCIPKVSPEGVCGAEWKKYLDKCVPDSDGGGVNRMLHHLKQMQQRMENEDRTIIRPNAIHVEESDEADEYTPPEDFGLLALQNRPPWWNIELGSFVLNFGGRVSVASVKNFQLCDRNDQDYIMLQFGRIQGRHSFTMDFQHPLTAVQAFAIAISSLQSKLSLG